MRTSSDIGSHTKEAERDKLSTYYIKADEFFFPNDVKKGGYLEVTDGKFGNYTTEKPDGEIVDYSDSWILPGLVETHIHGYLGHDVMDADPEGIRAMSKGLVSAGVTSFLPTTLTASEEQLTKAAEVVAEEADKVTGAKIQGIFFEGPFFTEEHKGAQNPKYFGNPSVEKFDRWQEASKGLIRKIAIAPERDDTIPFVTEMSRRGVKVALGHSSATCAQAKKAVDAGASVFVHTYNGMSGLNHREPGMVGAALTSDDAYAEIICDGHHVDPNAIDVVVRAKGPERTVLISDCMRAGGMPDGDYTLGEFPVRVENGAARLTSPGHSLAGSILRLEQAVQNVVSWNIATAADAVRMASETAAESAGIADRCGSIRPGRDADFIVVTPELQLEATYVDGIEKYKA